MVRGSQANQRSQSHQLNLSDLSRQVLPEAQLGHWVLAIPVNQVRQANRARLLFLAGQENLVDLVDPAHLADQSHLHLQLDL